MWTLLNIVAIWLLVNAFIWVKITPVKQPTKRNKPN